MSSLAVGDLGRLERTDGNAAVEEEGSFSVFLAKLTALA